MADAIAFLLGRTPATSTATISSSTAASPATTSAACRGSRDHARLSGAAQRRPTLVLTTPPVRIEGRPDGRDLRGDPRCVARGRPPRVRHRLGPRSPPQPERPLEVGGRGLDPARIPPHRGAADPRGPHGDGEHVPPSRRPGEDRDHGRRGVARARRGGPGRGLARGRAPPVRPSPAAARRADAPARGGLPDPAGALDRAARHRRGRPLPGAGGLPRAEAGPAAAPAARDRDQRREGRPPDRRAARPGVEHVQGHARGVPAPLELVDGFCREAGRAPAAVERSIQFGADALQNGAADLVALSREFVAAGATHLIYTCPIPYSAAGARRLWQEVVSPLRG